MTRFQVGDVVRMKSGGPPMTIIGFTNVGSFIPGDDVAIVSWFTNKGPCEGEVNVKALELESMISEKPPVTIDSDGVRNLVERMNKKLANP